MDAVEPARKKTPESRFRGTTLTFVHGKKTLAGPFDLVELPHTVQVSLALRQLRAVLLSAGDADERFARLRAGDTARRERKLPTIDAWRHAFALALADERARAANVRARSREYGELLGQAMREGAALDRRKLGRAKLIPEVVQHWAKLTKATPSAAALI